VASLGNPERAALREQVTCVAVASLGNPERAALREQVTCVAVASLGNPEGVAPLAAGVTRWHNAELCKD